jgi:beta-lactamase regulating signal transducer with metallopeptidase domain/protocatechuate 3,4-dioxygenase beta subunit
MMSLIGGWARSVVACGLDVGIKATVLLLAAAALHAALGRRRAAARSAAWNACLPGLLALPAASQALPRLRVDVGFGPRPEPAVVDVAETIAPVPVPRPVAPLPPARWPGGPQPVVEGQAPRFTPRTASATPKPPASTAGPGWPVVAAGLYLAGAGLLTIRLIGSLAAVGRLRRSGRPVDDMAWCTARDRWAAHLGMGRAVELLRSGRVGVPIAIGARRPAVVLPEGLDPARADAVVLHELAHIRRGDYAWNVVRVAVQVVYWPHPLAWLAGRWLASARETACDDLCVHALGGAATYRAALLDVAAGLARRPGPALGLAMARSSRLGRRLAWIDRTLGAPHCLLATPSRWAIAGLALLACGLIGAVELVRAGSPAVPKAKQADKPAKAVEIFVVAKDTGKPLPGAVVDAGIDLGNQEYIADAAGRVVIGMAGRMFPESLSFDAFADGYVQQRFFFRDNDRESSPIPGRITVSLLRGEETFGGAVVDEEGRPVAGAKVALWGYLGAKKAPEELCYMVHTRTDSQGRWTIGSLRAMTFANLYISHPDYLSDDDLHARRFASPDATSTSGAALRPLRERTDVQVLTRGIAVRGRVLDHEGRPVAGAKVLWNDATPPGDLDANVAPAPSGPDGRFVIPHGRPGKLALIAMARGHGPAETTVEAGPDTPPVEFRLPAPKTLKGRVVDDQNRPIPGAFVNVDTWRKLRCLRVFLATDADGRFRWDDAPADQVLLNVHATGFNGGFLRRRATVSDEDVLFTLPRAFTVVATIKDGASGKRIDTVSKFAAGTLDPATRQWAWAPLMTVSRPGEMRVESAADGRVRRYRIEAPGYEPYETRDIPGDPGVVKLDVALTKDKRQGPSGVVLRPDGAPAEGAEVIGATKDMPVALQAGEIQNRRNSSLGQNPYAKTGPDGRFTLPFFEGPFKVAVVHDSGFARLESERVKASSEIQLAPWGRVEGRLFNGSKPVAGQEIGMSSDDPIGASVASREVVDERGVKRRENVWSVIRMNDGGYGATTDATGRFVFDRVAPVDMELHHLIDRSYAHTAYVKVEPGVTTMLTMGGQGRPVVGRIVLPTHAKRAVDLTKFDTVLGPSLKTEPWGYPYPEGLSTQAKSKWLERWWHSPDGKAHRAGQNNRPAVVVPTVTSGPRTSHQGTTS